SVPLWFERHLGRAGRSLSDAVQRLSKSSGFSDNRWLQMANRRLVSLLPKATHFTTEEVALCLEAAIRKVLSHEGVLVLIRGNDDWAKMPFATRGFNRRNAARNAAMSAALRDVCARLRVQYYQQ